MARVITFSRTFPAYHQQAGQPTFFVEKVLNSIQKDNYWFGGCKCGWMGSGSTMEGGGQIADTGDYDDPRCPKCYSSAIDDIEVVSADYYIGKFPPKRHTIRAGNRWKVGDKFSPRVWSGKPYNSKQIVIAPDIEIKKVWSFEMNLISRPFFRINGKGLNNEQVELLAANDGLSYDDFKRWLDSPKPIIHSGFFTGQIICWDESVSY